MVKKPNKGRKKPSSDAREAGRIARRDRRREQAREEILDATEALLFEGGAAAVSVAAVSKRVGLTKPALYYYFKSKDELLFHVIFRYFREEAAAIRDAVEEASDGAEALRAIVGASFNFYRENMNLFRLVYLHPQVTDVKFAPSPEMLATIRPLNEWSYGRAQALLEADREAGLLPDHTDPRRLAFVAHMSALGVLTMKGMVEHSGDPLVHGDDDLLVELQNSFARAARK